METNFKNNGANKISKDIETLNKELTPFLQENLNKLNVDYKSSAIYFISVVGLLLNDINEPNFNKLLTEYFMKMIGEKNDV